MHSVCVVYHVSLLDYIVMWHVHIMRTHGTLRIENENFSSLSQAHIYSQTNNLVLFCSCEIHQFSPLLWLFIYLLRLYSTSAEGL